MEVMKRLRQRMIADLVAQRAVRTQQEIATALRDRGYRVTQATISRDVAELGLVKVVRDGAHVYALPAKLADADATGEERVRSLLRELPAEVGESGTMVIVRTLPGSAHSIAAAVDRARWPGVVGSVAGDDTVFIACRDVAARRRVRARIVRLAE